MTALRFNSTPVKGWTAPVGSAAHAYKHGRILPMEETPFLARLFGRKAA